MGRSFGSGEFECERTMANYAPLVLHYGPVGWNYAIMWRMELLAKSWVTLERAELLYMLWSSSSSSEVCSFWDVSCMDVDVLKTWMPESDCGLCDKFIWYWQLLKFRLCGCVWCSGPTKFRTSEHCCIFRNKYKMFIEVDTILRWYLEYYHLIQSI